MALRPSISCLAFGLSLALVACAGAKPKQVGDDDNFSQPRRSKDAPSDGMSDTNSGGGSDSAASAPSGDDEGKLNEEQIGQMEVALKRGATKAANCADVVPDAPRGEGEVEVTFDGQKGKVTDTAVGAPFAGTAVESCIKRSFIGEIIVPFSGDPKVVKYKVKLAEKPAATPPKKK